MNTASNTDLTKFYSTKAERRRRLFHLAIESVESGVQPFDEKHLLIRQMPDRGPSPHRAGLTVVQQTPEYAIALLETGRNPELALRILNRLLDYQCTDPNRYDFGNWLWMDGWERARDTNAVGMILPPLAYVLRHHGHRVESVLRERLLRAFDLAGHGLLGLRFTTAYTNMHVIRMLGLFIVAHFTKNARLRELAYWDWVEWMQEITLHGFNEYLSPTYTGTVLFALEELAEAPGVTPEFQEQVQQIITILWAQMLDWYHPPSGRLCGPFARSYDPRLLPGGADSGVSQLFWREFGDPEPEPLPSTVCARWAMSEWVMPDEIHQQLARRTWPHRVEGRAPFWPEDHRSGYQTETFALGVKCGGHRSGADEIPLFLSWADTHPRHTLFLSTDHAGITHHATQDDFRVLGACLTHQPMPNHQSPELPVFWGLKPPQPLPTTVRVMFHLGASDQMDIEASEGALLPNVPLRWNVGPIACVWQWLPRSAEFAHAALVCRAGEWLIEVSLQTDHLPPGTSDGFAYALVVAQRAESVAPIQTRPGKPQEWPLHATLGGSVLNLTVPLDQPFHHRSQEVLVTEETYFGVSLWSAVRQPFAALGEL